jgi:uncharacterized protein YbjT (DUF2867 family)
MTTILVTGASGFVGARLLRRLANRPDGHVRGLVRKPPPCSLPPSVECVQGELNQPDTLAAALEGVQHLVHAAAITADHKEPYRGAYEQVNKVGTEHLMRAATGAGVERVVLVSGLGTRPAPRETYMATRWGMEEAVRHGGIPFVILQPSVLFGDGAPFVSALAELARRSPVLPLLGGGGIRFQPLWIEDLVTCLEACLRDQAPLGEALPIGGAEHVTFRQVLGEICAALHVRRLLVPLPLGLARLQATVMTAVLPRPPLTPAALELFTFDNATDLDSVERTFGFTPRGFREHLRERGVET